jgi:hypothetical protein
MAPHASSDYAEQVHFVKVETDDGAALIMWPCVYFPNKEELRTASVDLLSSLGHGKREKLFLEMELSKHNSRMRVAQLRNPFINSIEADSSVAYLLGKKTPGNNKILVFEPTLEDFQSHFDDARSKFSGYQGFKDALTEAMNLIVCGLADDTRLDSPITHGLESEPEFSRARLRFSKIPSAGRNNNILWPCIIFHKSESFVNGLVSREMLSSKSDKLKFYEEYTKLLEERRAPPAVYYFGEPPGGRKVSAVSQGDCLLAYETTVATAVIDYVAHAGFFRAHKEAALAVSTAASQARLVPPASIDQRNNSMTQNGNHPNSKKRKALGDCSKKRIPKKKNKPSQKSSAAIEGSIATIPLVDKEVSLPLFSEVRPTLEKAGYIFRDNLYCCPGKDPYVNQKAQEGIDFFELEDAFRAHLCSKGVSCRHDGFRWRSSDPATQASNKRLEAWVCYHHLARLLGERTISDVEKMTGPCETALIQNLGISWNNGRWRIPEMSKPLEEDELSELLARNGVPKACKFSNISSNDLLRVTLYICRPSRRRMPVFL